MALNKRKTRMYEPWGYREENEYQGSATILENDLNSLFASAEYDKKDGYIYFKNKDGEEVGKLDTSDFSSGGGKEVDTITYNSETQTVVIKYKDGSTINVPVKIDKNEFKDGLSVTTTTSSGVKTNVIKVKKDPTSEPWLSVSTNGVKVSGIQAQVDRLDGKIDDEISRATEEEQRIEEKIDKEISDRESAYTALQEEIDQERERAISAETELGNRIDEISGDTSGLEELKQRLGYKDNDTLALTNTHEVAFGEYNESNTSEDPSGQTIFSIGIGTSDSDRKNALEVRKNGDVYMWIEGEYMQVNDLLGQIAHELYD